MENQNNQSTFNKVKEHKGQKYTGMTIGNSHHWHYDNAEVHETKIAPNAWRFNLTSIKRRHKSAPVGSGCENGTQYHWFIIGSQIVTKTDQDHYNTELEAVKYKLGHARPHWKNGMSYNYKEQKPLKEQIKNALQTYYAYSQNNALQKQIQELIKTQKEALQKWK